MSLKIEIAVGLYALIAALLGQQIQISHSGFTLYHEICSGLGGIFGTYVFMRRVGFKVDHEKVIALLMGAGMAALFAPLLANAGSHYMPVIFPDHLLVDAAAGCAIGMLSTPLLGFIRDPKPTLEFLVSLWKKKE